MYLREASITNPSLTLKLHWDVHVLEPFFESQKARTQGENTEIKSLYESQKSSTQGENIPKQIKNMIIGEDLPDYPADVRNTLKFMRDKCLEKK